MRIVECLDGPYEGHIVRVPDWAVVAGAKPYTDDLPIKRLAVSAGLNALADQFVPKPRKKR